ncbi:MAG: hypothetical protein OXF89_15785 [Rhodospirillaceae bacterium]|nr:hypothetical protein [Rhodospirillaceae bacterium]
MTRALRWGDAGVDVATLPAGGAAVRLSAGAKDRRAIAGRLQLPSVEACAATFALRAEPGRGVLVEGRLRARLVRRCVVSGDAMEEIVDRAFESAIVREEPAAAEDDAAEEMDYEVAPDGRVDLAELAIQILAVSMAAYPRGPGADAVLAEFGAQGDAAGGQEKPFAGLGARLGMPGAEPDGAEGGDADG